MRTWLAEKLRRAAWNQYQKSRNSLARQLLTGAAWLGGSDTWLYDFFGLLEMKRGHYRAAEKRLRRALQLEPGNTRGRIRLVRSLLAMGLAETAATEAQPLVTVDEISMKLAYEVGTALARCEEHQRALEWFEVAQRLDPQREEPQLGVAHGYLSLGVPETARRTYQKLAHNAKNPGVQLEATMGLSKALYDLELVEEARGAAIRAARLVRHGEFSPAERQKVRALVAWLRSVGRKETARAESR